MEEISQTNNKIILDLFGFETSCNFKDEDPSATDLVRAFTGLLVTQTFSLGVICNALEEDIHDLEEESKYV